MSHAGPIKAISTLPAFVLRQLMSVSDTLGVAVAFGRSIADETIQNYSTRAVLGGRGSRPAASGHYEPYEKCELLGHFGDVATV